MWAIAGTMAAGLFASTAFFLFLELRQLTPVNSALGSGACPPDRVALGNDFSTSNTVSVILGRTELDGGITHLPDFSDGWTRADELEGVPCRYMNHRAANLMGGACLYFAVHTSFKSVPIKMARIEFEYLVRTPVRLKVQYDGMEEGRRRSYKPAGEILNVTEVGSWQTAVFHVSEAAFMNSQNGGADFRLDVNPPEIYVRRV
ncbi:MAG TPA: hypothetical protein VK633_12150, partial [Verrucomicrobiae bacterium]|nr:hypothetical protein [Verrucomicrobiae bacterium]